MAKRGLAYLLAMLRPETRKQVYIAGAVVGGIFAALFVAFVVTDGFAGCREDDAARSRQRNERLDYADKLPKRFIHVDRASTKGFHDDTLLIQRFNPECDAELVLHVRNTDHDKLKSLGFQTIECIASDIRLDVGP